MPPNLPQWSIDYFELKLIEKQLAGSDERREFIAFRLKEIDAAELKIGELEELTAESKKDRPRTVFFRYILFKEHHYFAPQKFSL